MERQLLIVTPDNATKRVTLDGSTLSLGRAHTNDLCYPDDASLSRNHLVVGTDDAGVWVEDLGSKNGTLLNGARLAQRERLKLGDRINVGRLELTLVDPDTDSAVMFVPSDLSDTSQGAVMTRLADLLSGEVISYRGAAEPITGDGLQAIARPSFDTPIVRLLLRAGRELAAHRPLDELFALILNLSIEAVAAERGLLMVLEGERLVVKAQHGDQFRISATIRDKVLQEKTSLLVQDMTQEEAFRGKVSISGQQIHTMMAVPLQTEDRVIGLVYVDSRMFLREFTPDDLNLLTFLGNVAAIRIVQVRLAQLERENEQAGEIQRRILPQAAPLIPGIDLAGHNAPCRTVGGDYYDFLPYADGRVGIVLADVAGKGMSAALMMSNLQPRVQMLSEDITDLGRFMSRLDRSLVKACPSNRFITLFFCVLDPANGKMDFVNAGHNPPLVVRNDGSVDRLKAAGTVLGMLPELGYEQRSTLLEPGELLAIFSDGVTESVDVSGVEFGEQRLADLLVGQTRNPACEIIGHVLSELDAWTGGAPPEDDVTLVVVRRTR